jgi:hypothetical protein
MPLKSPVWRRIENGGRYAGQSIKSPPSIKPVKPNPLKGLSRRSITAGRRVIQNASAL